MKETKPSKEIVEICEGFKKRVNTAYYSGDRCGFWRGIGVGGGCGFVFGFLLAIFRFHTR